MKTNYVHLLIFQFKEGTTTVNAFATFKAALSRFDYVISKRREWLAKQSTISHEYTDVRDIEFRELSYQDETEIVRYECHPVYTLKYMMERNLGHEE